MKDKLDLTTSWQKSIAILILLGLGFIVVKFLPVFIMAGIIGLGLIFHIVQEFLFPKPFLRFQ